ARTQHRLGHPRPRHPDRRRRLLGRFAHLAACAVGRVGAEGGLHRFRQGIHLHREAGHHERDPHRVRWLRRLGEL
ncbi:MAG: hypothetical protein AVDCRST_MAG89-6, partial [uncultured Gemmatimonadetes bacterium]